MMCKNIFIFAHHQSVAAYQAEFSYEYGIIIRMMPENDPQLSKLRAPWIPPQIPYSDQPPSVYANFTLKIQPLA